MWDHTLSTNAVVANHAFWTKAQEARERDPQAFITKECRAELILLVLCVDDLAQDGYEDREISTLLDVSAAWLDLLREVARQDVASMTKAVQAQPTEHTTQVKVERIYFSKEGLLKAVLEKCCEQAKAMQATKTKLAEDPNSDELDEVLKDQIAELTATTKDFYHHGGSIEELSEATGLTEWSVKGMLSDY